MLDPDNLEKFQRYAKTRASLWRAKSLTLHQAVDSCYDYACKLGINTDLGQAVMANVFAQVRDDLGGWIPPDPLKTGRRDHG